MTYFPTFANPGKEKEEESKFTSAGQAFYVLTIKYYLTNKIIRECGSPMQCHALVQ